ncbi:MAG: hypothetical protein KF752_01705 [Pirellulaceae bacterium]|nr:hypothetical protein [Pirellulaceae bacterium]
MNKDRSLPFRCQVAPENASAIIKMGRRQMACQVVDVSREDFHVQLTRRKINSLSRAKRLEVHYNSERWQVEFSGLANMRGDSAYLTRVKELTQETKPSAWMTLLRPQANSYADPRFTACVILAIIAACLALPGLGDGLGTAPKVKKGVHSVVNSFK